MRGKVRVHSAGKNHTEWNGDSSENDRLYGVIFWAECGDTCK